MKIIIVLGLLSCVCFGMDKPLGSKKAVSSQPMSPVLNLRPKAIFDYINEGNRLTEQELIALSKNNRAAIFWDVYGRWALTNIKLVRSHQRAPDLHQPRTLVEQATKAVAQLPAAHIKNFPDPILRFNIIMKREKPDIQEIITWFQEYMSGDIAKKKNAILERWNQIIDHLSVEQSKKVLAALVGPWLKTTNSDPQRYALAMNMVEALAEYQCKLRDVLATIFKENKLLNNIAILFKNIDTAQLGELALMEPRRLAQQKQLMQELIDDRERCKIYCLEQIYDALGLPPERKIKKR